MTLIVEDGSIVSGANSYISTSDFTTYATARNYTLVSGAETLLIQAMDYLESLDFKGIKKTQAQLLQWPRNDVIIDGYLFASDDIPQLLIDAQCEVAIAIDSDESPAASIEPAVKRSKVDVIEVEYKDGAASTTINRKIKLKLKKLLRSSGYAFEVVKA